MQRSSHLPTRGGSQRFKPQRHQQVETPRRLSSYSIFQRITQSNTPTKKEKKEHFPWRTANASPLNTRTVAEAAIAGFISTAPAADAIRPLLIATPHSPPAPTPTSDPTLRLTTATGRPTHWPRGGGAIIIIIVVDMGPSS
ncbi:hypothetical protein M406DRAFT_354919 [Cryphonectria parasitica EP155]|uniref:Uncharacterized protein n=1 Tax=Cryphonectria parasitica (strain ATCC 38755 / EP155) TaxID=660469 RepID=A0A9P5CRS5_CRYP1|nr:uncharacterized protein M406DRAFT_354919 [Cryphonectria parasitica EP155]KAF3768558.1 hypothetical protein M406DRAFT_354919 [Cryphonectria parasitica EP155]